MPIYNFKKRFASAVRAGTKRQTIRARGKRPPPKVGEIAHCYTGLRTHGVCRLGTFPIERVTQISISASSRIVSVPRGNAWHCLSETEVEQLAKDDGFPSGAEFFAFFKHEHGGTFSGYLIQWSPEQTT